MSEHNLNESRSFTPSLEKTPYFNTRNKLNAFQFEKLKLNLNKIFNCSLCKAEIPGKDDFCGKCIDKYPQKTPNYISHLKIDFNQWIKSPYYKKISTNRCEKWYKTNLFVICPNCRNTVKFYKNCLCCEFTLEGVNFCSNCSKKLLEPIKKPMITNSHK